jgi:hypothetical protein
MPSLLQTMMVVQVSAVKIFERAARDRAELAESGYKMPRRSKILGLIVISAMALSLLSGLCSDSLAQTSPGPNGEIYCRNNTDCPPGGDCRYSFATHTATCGAAIRLYGHPPDRTPPPTCHTDNDCQTGYTCGGGEPGRYVPAGATCIRMSPMCKTDDDCLADEYCHGLGNPPDSGICSPGPRDPAFHGKPNPEPQ